MEIRESRVITVLSIVAAAAVIGSVSVFARGDAADPQADRIASLRYAALEEKRWAHLLDSVYMITAMKKCLAWPASITERVTALKAEATIFESTLRVDKPTKDELDKIEAGIAKWRAERLSLLRDVDTKILRGSTPPEKSVYSENGGK